MNLKSLVRSPDTRIEGATKTSGPFCLDRLPLQYYVKSQMRFCGSFSYGLDAVSEEFPFSFMLRRSATSTSRSQMFGLGVDPIGVFTVRGTVTQADVELVKRYAGEAGYELTYRGQFVRADASHASYAGTWVKHTGYDRSTCAAEGTWRAVRERLRNQRDVLTLGL